MKIRRKPKLQNIIINTKSYDCFQGKYKINVYYVTLSTVIECLETKVSNN